MWKSFRRAFSQKGNRAQQRISILVPLLRYYRVPEFLFYPVPPIYFRGAHTREREREEEFARVLMNLYESPLDETFFLSLRARIENSIHRKYRKVMRALRKKPLFVQRKSILPSLMCEVRKLQRGWNHRLEPRTSPSIALRIAWLTVWATEGQERKSEIRNIYVYVHKDRV